VSGRWEGGGPAATLEIGRGERLSGAVARPRGGPGPSPRRSRPRSGGGKSLLIVALAVLYPFHTYIANVNVSAGDGIVALIGGVLVFRFAAGHVTLPRYTVHAFFLWLVILVSLTTNSLVPTGFFGLVPAAVEALKYVAAVAWMVALYWLVSEQLPRRLLLFSCASVVMATGFALWTIYQNLFLHLDRPTGPFENANLYGNYLVLNVFLALAAANLLAEDRWGIVTGGSLILRSGRTAALLFVIPVLTVGILATGSRGTLVAFLVGLLVALRIRPPTAFGPRQVLAGVVGALALAAALAWFLAHHPYVLVRLARTGSTDPNVQHRLALWRAALDAVYSHPLFGIGYGQFTSYAGYLRLWRAQVAHETYLSLAAELGLLGLAVFLWLLRAVIRDSWRVRPAVGSRLGKLCCGFVVATSVQGLFTNVDSFRSLWIAFGLVAALLVFAGGVPGAPGAPPLRVRPARHVGPARTR
jgi:O-antigen ligase